MGCQSSAYNKAVSLMDNGEYEEAIYQFKLNEDYKNSSELVEECYKKIFSNVSLGDEVTFGSYEQDNNSSDGKEVIEWTVLDSNENGVLLISNNALDSKPYHDDAGNTDITWETCSLREWLNNGFINDSFSAGEQKDIKSTLVKTDPNPEYESSPAVNDTEDKVFLLSNQELDHYYPSDNERTVTASESVKQSEVYWSDNENCIWWLRSMNMPGIASFVDNDGIVDKLGDGVGSIKAVRPVLWVSFD